MENNGLPIKIKTRIDSLFVVLHSLFWLSNKLKNNISKKDMDWIRSYISTSFEKSSSKNVYGRTFDDCLSYLKFFKIINITENGIKISNEKVFNFLFSDNSGIEQKKSEYEKKFPQYMKKEIENQHSLSRLFALMLKLNLKAIKSESGKDEFLINDLNKIYLSLVKGDTINHLMQSAYKNWSDFPSNKNRIIDSKEKRSCFHISVLMYLFYKTINDKGNTLWTFPLTKSTESNYTILTYEIKENNIQDDSYKKIINTFVLWKNNPKRKDNYESQENDTIIVINYKNIKIFFETLDERELELSNDSNDNDSNDIVLKLPNVKESYIPDIPDWFIKFLTFLTKEIDNKSENTNIFKKIINEEKDLTKDLKNFLKKYVYDKYFIDLICKLYKESNNSETEYNLIYILYSLLKSLNPFGATLIEEKPKEEEWFLSFITKTLNGDLDKKFLNKLKKTYISVEFKTSINIEEIEKELVVVSGEKGVGKTYLVTEQIYNSKMAGKSNKKNDIIYYWDTILDEELNNINPNNFDWLNLKNDWTFKKHKMKRIFSFYWTCKRKLFSSSSFISSKYTILGIFVPTLLVLIGSIIKTSILYKDSFYDNAILIVLCISLSLIIILMGIISKIPSPHKSYRAKNFWKI